MNIFGQLKDWAKALKTQISALYIAYQRPDVPLISKMIISLVIAYAVSPIDLIPDFIPVLGWLDELLLLPIGCWLAIQFISDEVWFDCKLKAKENPIQLPENRWVMWAIILLWCVLTAWFVYLIWPTFTGSV